MFVTPNTGIYPDGGTDQKQLVMHPDRAMNEAKDEGKNNFRFFARQVTSSPLERITFESELRNALVADEFRVHYQPVYDLHSGDIVSVEALLPWQHPTRALLALGAFTTAKDSALIVPIGARVLREPAGRRASGSKRVSRSAICRNNRLGGFPLPRYCRCGVQLPRAEVAESHQRNSRAAPKGVNCASSSRRSGPHSHG